MQSLLVGDKTQLALRLMQVPKATEYRFDSSEFCLRAIHKQRRRFLAILDPFPPHIDPYRLLNAPPLPNKHCLSAIYDPSPLLLIKVWRYS